MLHVVKETKEEAAYPHFQDRFGRYDAIQERIYYVKEQADELNNRLCRINNQLYGSLSNRLEKFGWREEPKTQWMTTGSDGYGGNGKAYKKGCGYYTFMTCPEVKIIGPKGDDLLRLDSDWGVAGLFTEAMVIDLKYLGRALDEAENELAEHEANFKGLESSEVV